MSKIPNFRPYKARNEIKYVKDCIDTGWLGHGKYQEFAKEKIREIFGIEYVILVNSGTAACKLALIGCGIGKKDKVISPTFTFIATNHSILSVGAKPIFVDSNLLDWNIDTVDIIKKIRKYKIKAVFAVNLLGYPVHYNNFYDVCKAEKIKIIEDNCQSIFAKYYGKYTGTIGDASSFSFFSNKIISSGEGGMVIFKNKQDYERALSYKNQGRDYKQGKYYHSQYGENMNLTNLQAAIILSQLEEYKYILFKRQKIDQWYRRDLEGQSKIIHILPEFRTNLKEIEPVNLFTTILIDNRDKYVVFMKKHGVEVTPVWKPNHKMPHLQKYAKDKYPKATNISGRGAMLPTFVGMSEKQVKKVCVLTKRFLKNERS